MNLESNQKKIDYNNRSLKIITLTGKNPSSEESEAFPTKNIQAQKISFENQPAKKIELVRVSKKSKNYDINTIYKSNPKYKFLIKKIAQRLRKRVNFPKCKLFKFYQAYRTLVLRIALGLKRTAKKPNFWEKWNSMTEQEVNQIQEIAFTACKIIQEKGKNKISSSDRKKNKNIKIGLSLFRKAEEAKIINSKDDKSTTLKEINKLKIININDKKFLENFSEFLSGNSIEIFSDIKLPNITNNKYIFLFTQNEFWIKYIIYISIKYKKDLSIFNFIIFIELFYTWNNNSLDNDFNQEIIKAITSIFDNETINKFL